MISKPMRFIRGLLVVSLLAAQPLQLAIAANLGQLGLELSHGITQSYGVYDQECIGGTGVNNVPCKTIHQYLRYELPGALGYNNTNYVVQGTTCDTRNYGIPAQVTNMSACQKGGVSIPWPTNLSYGQSVESLASYSSVNKIVMMGHSQGGLRAREYLQTGNPSVGGRSKVVGLITTGTPHNGAPITQNVFGFAGELGMYVNVLAAGLGVALFEPFGLTWQMIGGFAGGIFSFIGLQNVFGNLQDAAFGPGGSQTDMTPGSAFLNRINNIPTSLCEWRSRDVLRINGEHEEYWTTEWYQVCQEGPTGPGIPKNVATLSIVGQNNNIDAVIGSQGYSARMGIGLVLGVTAIGLWANAWWNWWWIPAASAASMLSFYLLSLPWIWQGRVVGSDRGDSVVPEDSQNWMASNGRMYASDNVGRFDQRLRAIEPLPDGTHGGSELGEYRHRNTSGAVANFLRNVRDLAP